ncbi:MAG: formylglycine-generating enzyme family protein [Chlamydia sp.]
MPQILSLLLFFIQITLFAHETQTHPSGMVWIPAGSFWMGCDSKDAKSDEQPIHLVQLDGFWMDETCVTNEQFAKFVAATGYITTAEKDMLHDKETLPSSFIFKEPKEETPLHDHSVWWQSHPGTSWKNPRGPGSSIDGKELHPVVHVSWEDAKNYATWAKKRLPTEAEWEYAARGDSDFAHYAWGNDEFCEESPQANLWHGHFPHKSSKESEQIGTSSVKSYCPNSFKLYDMAGNVWQWCSDYYDSEFYREEVKKKLSVNPTGPIKSPSLPVTRVQRGGSFLCHKSYCKGYRTTARMKAPETASFQHSGFRCALSTEL